MHKKISLSVIVNVRFPKKVLFLVYLISASVGNVYSQSPVDYGSHEGKYLSINDTRIYYEEYGSGVPLLLLHGGFGSISDFKKVIPGLSRKFRVIIPDFPGHGRSEQADSLSYSLLADYFGRFINDLGLDSVYIIGWSDGKNAALLLAAEPALKVKRILVCGANSVSDDGAIDFFKKIDPSFVEKNQKEWLVNYLQRLPQGENWRKFIHDMRRMYLTKTVIPQHVLAKINVPVLIVLGDHDSIRLEHGIEMHRAIVNSQFSVLPQTSHMVFDESPELINFIAFQFFR